MTPTIVVTTAGLALLTEIANAHGTLEWTRVEGGDGVLGATDPLTLTALISKHQEWEAVDVKVDGNGIPYVYCTMDNDGLVTGYLRREVGVYGQLVGETGDDTLILYLYAATDPEADYIPAEGDAANTITGRLRVVEAGGLAVTVSIDQSTVFLNLERWADHLAGGGGVDQHPLATTSAPGLMSATDKTDHNAHINTGTPSRGTSIHSVVTQSIAGFASAADKTKLDGIQAGAQVNAPDYGTIRGFDTPGHNLLWSKAADVAGDYLDFFQGANITIELVPIEWGGNRDGIIISATGLAPLSHVGSGGSQHAAATTSADGFMQAAMVTKLATVATGAQVNQYAFGRVRVGSTFVDADQQVDVLEFAAGANITITPDGPNDKLTIAASGVLQPYYVMKILYGYTGPITGVLAQPNCRPCGMLVSPMGGIHFSSPGTSDIAIDAVFERYVHNEQVTTQDHMIACPLAPQELHYQIDGGTIINITPAGQWNQSVIFSIPPGVHVLRFYVRSVASNRCQFDLADWQLLVPWAQTHWESGWTYY
jgi:hypothetical protein